jgi:two-component system response regulator YesN
VFNDEDYRRLFAALNKAGHTVRCMPDSLSTAVRQFVPVLHRTQDETLPLDDSWLRAEICRILVESVRALSPAAVADTSSLVQAVRVFVASHYKEEKMRAEDIARHTGYAVAWLQKRFKRESGYTLNHYIQRYRVEMAKRLLRETDRGITDIALDCGCSSSQQFCRVFRRIAGETASQYRRTARTG